MTAPWSLNEIEALAKKAARGIGYSWGIAEDAGRAVRWLEARGLPGAKALESLAEARITKGSPECTLTIGCALSDGVFDTEVGSFGQLTSPILLIPFAAWVAERRQLGLAVHIDENVVRLSADGELLDGAIASPKTGLVTVEPHDIDDQTVTPGHRAFVDCDTIVALEAMAHKTYAPATAASREAGAGAGLTDND